MRGTLEQDALKRNAKPLRLSQKATHKRPDLRVASGLEGLKSPKIIPLGVLSPSAGLTTGIRKHPGDDSLASLSLSGTVCNHRLPHRLIVRVGFVSAFFNFLDFSLPPTRRSMN